MIRTAATSDMPAVVKIAESVRLDLRHPQPDIAHKGFLVYVLEETGYARRENEFQTVNVHNGTIHGFLMCYSVDFLHGLLGDGSISHQDGATRFLMSLSDQSFILGDQIGVDPHTTRKGIGRELMLDMFERMRRSGVAHMYVTILHDPVRNDASIKFCEGLGARCVQEVANKDGLIWGIYRFTP